MEEIGGVFLLKSKVVVKPWNPQPGRIAAAKANKIGVNASSVLRPKEAHNELLVNPFLKFY